MQMQKSTLKRYAREIIHLGDFWNENKLKENRNGIVNTIDENAKMYRRIYKYLEAAKLMRDD
ncbi:MAG: hypothetical protein ACLKAK_12915, partial [Alkaliphilus sp.]